MQDHCFRQNKFLVQETKKMDCPSAIHVQHIVKYPDVKVRLSYFVWTFIIYIYTKYNNNLYTH
jgi:hypothetical protein